MKIVTENEVKIRLKDSTGPQGPKGDKGDSGVHVGKNAPKDPNVVVWINPNGTPSAGSGGELRVDANGDATISGSSFTVDENGDATF